MLFKQGYSTAFLNRQFQKKKEGMYNGTGKTGRIKTLAMRMTDCSVTLLVAANHAQ